MCIISIPYKTRFVPRRTLRRLRPEEYTISNESELNKIRAFDNEIKMRLGDSIISHRPDPPENNDRTTF